MISRLVAGRLVAAGALLTAALAGCAESGADTASSRPMPPAAADPPQPHSTPDPAATGAQTPGGPGDAAAGPLVPDLPSVAPSPVFLGEACDPDRDSEPATAVNGLVLYCAQVPEITGADPSGVGRWSPGPPSQGTPTGPEPGGECDPADVGKVVPGADGRPLSCLREPDGAMRWADVS